jgi:hypothetical protein
VHWLGGLVFYRLVDTHLVGGKQQSFVGFGSFGTCVVHWALIKAKGGS